MSTLQYDAIIIGFGKGGKTLAAKLGKSGRKVALIEKEKTMYGGTCINVGCIPSKSLIHSAALAAQAASGDRAAAYREAVERMQRLTADLRQKNYQKLASIDMVTIYDGAARFAGPREVEAVTDNGVIRLTADRIFINTGSTPRIPSIQGITDTPGVYTSAGLMNHPDLPERLVIIGGGYIGLEFASLYSGFGSKVTVLQDGDVFLPREDEDVSSQIRSILEARGIAFHTGVSVDAVTQGPCVEYTEKGQRHRLQADAVLAATGRVPNTKDLNCEAAGIGLTPTGAVRTDEFLRTTAPGVWAMGDAAGGLQHTYISLDDSRIVLSQLTQGRPYTTAMRRNVPYSVFLSTPYARVGMNEKEALAAGYSVRTAVLPAAAVPKAQVLRKTDGLLKAVVDRDTGKILGVMLLCEESYEMINVVKLAMDAEADYTVLRDCVYTHPTMTEALNDLFQEVTL